MSSIREGDREGEEEGEGESEREKRVSSSMDRILHTNLVVILIWTEKV